MKNFMVITPVSNATEKLSEELSNANFSSESFNVLFYDYKMESKVIDYIRVNRPRLILVDGRGLHVSISNIYDTILAATGAFDIYTVVYSIYRETNLQGVKNIKLEDISRILESP